MNWKKKMRKLMAENPDALHPSLKAMAGRKSAIVSASLLHGQSKDLQLDQIKTCILHFIDFLRQQQLLNELGISWHDQVREDPDADVGIYDEHLSGPGLGFAKTTWKGWFQTYGLNACLGADLGEESSTYLSQHYEAFKTGRDHTQH